MKTPVRPAPAPRPLVPALALVLVPALASCLENEEEIEVRPDGSIAVEVSARGDLDDLADGYPVPFGGPWKPVGPDARRWLAAIGEDTGSPEVRDRAATVPWPVNKDGKREARLRSRAELDSIEDWPRLFAPEGETYRSAYLERSASLSVRSTASGRTVYVFERVYHGRPHRTPLEKALQEIPEELSQKIDDDLPLSREEWDTIAAILRESFADAAESFARQAVLGLYTEGDASLSPSSLKSAVARVRSSVEAVVTTDRMIAIHAQLEEEEAARESGVELAEERSDPIEDLENEVRATLRAELEGSLDREGVSPTTRNAVLYGLEWALTASDHAADLGDEKFTVRVRLPGTVVGGNVDAIEGGRAVWRFNGKDLHNRDLVMRAVSVVE